MGRVVYIVSICFISVDVWNVCIQFCIQVIYFRFLVFDKMYENNTFVVSMFRFFSFITLFRVENVSNWGIVE